MQQTGQVIIHIDGKIDGQKLTPQNYDIALLSSVLDNALKMLYPDQRHNRPIVTYEMQEGSVSNIFNTTRQRAKEITAVLSMVLAGGQTLDMLEPATAQAIEDFQQFSIQNNLNVDIYTSQSNENEILKINPTTHYSRTENVWVSTEIYLYGTLVDAGGKNNASIKLDTKNGLYVIKTNKDYLSNISGNPLYRKFGARVNARKSLASGIIDKQDLTLISLIDYSPAYDEAYLNSLIAQATPIWSGTDADEFVRDLRGGGYEGE